MIKVFVILLGISLAALLAACTGHKVLLEVPPFDDKLPEITTGFYTVHNINNGNVSEETSTDFLGELVYLYKDDIFVDGNYFSGI
ncbi:MAG: hypothetical protein KAI29_03560, partial [Cyclobacteriaceae bacterium]|nr:hypothetical protein [Cyclobacteriaceae bacterium]